MRIKAGTGYKIVFYGFILFSLLCYAYTICGVTVSICKYFNITL